MQAFKRDTGTIYIVELAAGVLVASDGSPVHAVSFYAAAPADGRRLWAITRANPGNGTPATYVSYYAAGTLMTTDGRPVHAVDTA